MHQNVLDPPVDISISRLLLKGKKVVAFDERIEMFLQKQEGLAPWVKTVLLWGGRLDYVINFDSFPSSLFQSLVERMSQSPSTSSTLSCFACLGCRSMEQEHFIQQQYSTSHNANLLSRTWRPTSGMQRCTGAEATTEAAWHEGWMGYRVDKEMPKALNIIS